MRRLLRTLFDKLFTGLAGLSILLMAAALVIVLGPILWRGAGAVVFRGTVEFREMMLAEFGHGSSTDIQRETQTALQARKGVYEILDSFSRGMDAEAMGDHARHVHRQLKAQLRNRVEENRMSRQEADELSDAGKKIRDDLVAAYEATTNAEARQALAPVLEYDRQAAFHGTLGERLFALGAEYKHTLDTVDLSRRKQYAAAVGEVKDILRDLLGPAPGERPEADLAQFKYGATRWDQAHKHLDHLLWTEQWVSDGPGRPLRKVRAERAKAFQGTELAKLFPLVQSDLEEMLRPRWTFYWRYFTDRSTPGSLFGGVGPEMLGTLLLAVLSMAFAVPVGIVTAAYLVECTREGTFVRVIRTCINTLAGVPSIVFGLFGMAFFVLYCPDKLNAVLGWLGWDWRFPTQRAILYGSLTLAVLVLPVMIRASEETIRAVPASYKEASLSLGASGFRTFVSVTLPAALPGILTGIILCMSRAAGETAPIMFTAAVALGPLPGSVLDPIVALPYSSYVFATSDNLAPKAPHNQYGMVMALVLLVLTLNVLAIVLRWRVSRKLQGR